jgi:exodeoxyribonuclease VII large subunit
MAVSVNQNNQSKLASRPVKDVYPVTRLVREARAALEGSFPLVWVEGEISNLAMPASGHIYFTLKDEVAQVRCAMFRNRNQHLRFTPENGMQVLLRARVTMYEARGEFQVIAEHMEEAGSGALQRAYEALKQRLGEEGLFAQEHKQALPTIPKKVGVVSSPDGAAVHDILSVIGRRFPSCEVILYPVAVQGEGSITQIADAINTANQRNEVDVLIVGRGGGSLEDLWSFNDEKVARAIFASQLPVISAVGHEIDFTIADFVADVRAPTPSAAAELAVPDANELLLTVRNLTARLSATLNQRLQQQQQHVDHLVRRLPKPHLQLTQQQQHLTRLSQQLQLIPARYIQAQQQKLDYLTARLKHPQTQIDMQKQKLVHLTLRLEQLMQKRVQQTKLELKALTQKLTSLLPINDIQQHRLTLKQLQHQLHHSMQAVLLQKRTLLSQNMRTLSAVSPLNTLERGYSITTNEQGSVIQTAKQVSLGENVTLKLHQGQLKCEVKQINDD